MIDISAHIKIDRSRVADSVMALIPSEGWQERTLERACEASGYHGAAHIGFFPRGLSDVYALWRWERDQEVLKIWPWERLEPLRVRERISTLLLERFILMEPCKQAVRIATFHVRRDPYFCTQMLFKTAHAFWCAAGDQSVDGNFYSKRALLAWVDRGSFKDWLHQHPTHFDDLDACIQARIQRVFKVSHTLKTWGHHAQTITRPWAERVARMFSQSREGK